MCRVESSLNPWAVRFEPGYRYFFEPVKFAGLSGISVDTERTLQATSFGLMQIMGGVTREHAYLGDLIRLASEHELALRLAIRHLKKKITKYGIVESIPAYNAGSPQKTAGGMWKNQRYVDKVHAELLKLDHPLAYAR